MHQLKIFENEEFGQVRTLLIDGQPWLVGKDVADILEYRNGSRDINRHVDEEDRQKQMIFDGNQMKKSILINESGFYSLVLSSKLPTAKKFKRWVTSEILPSIRKHGSYMTDKTLAEVIKNPDSLEMLLQELVNDKREKQVLHEKLSILEPKGVYFDNLISTDMLTAIRDTANEFKIKPMKFTQFLLDNKYVYRKKNQRIFPYQQYVHLGLFQIKDFCNNGYYCEQTCITVRGKLYFLQLLKEKNMI